MFKRTKAKLIHNLREKYKLKELLEITAFPKATYFYWVARFERSNPDEQLERELLALRKANPNYGYHRMVQALKKNGFIVNHKKVQCLMKS